MSSFDLENKNSGKNSSSAQPRELSRKVIVLKLLTKAPDQDGRKEKVFKFDKERIVLGSVISADLRLTGDGISPIHAVLEINTDSKTGAVFGTLFDLASDTGVFVDDKKIVTHRLSNQSQIVLGRHRLIFSLEDIQKGKEKTREVGGRTLFLSPDENLEPLNLEDEGNVIEIFDYRPSNKRALEVVMSWCGIILEVEHFTREKKVTVGGTRKSDFAIPSTLSSRQYSIITQKNNNYFLNLDQHMRGVMQKSGELQTLDEIRKSSIKGARGYEIPLGNNDFAKVSLGDIDFYFSFTSAPPRLKRKRLFERDPFFHKIFFFSMILTALALFSLSKVKLPQEIDAEQVPERIATILYQPEKFLTPPPVPTPKPSPIGIPPAPQPQPTPKETPKPKVSPLKVKPKAIKVTVKPKVPVTHKPLPKVMKIPTVEKPVEKVVKKAIVPPVVKPPAPQPVPPVPATKVEAKEGEGARAKGVEGSRGELHHKVTQLKITELSRPSPHSGLKGASGNSQLSEEGNVDLLKGAGGRIQNILGNSAARLGTGSENLKGFGTFSTGGNGGLALSGKGRGGGGNAETTLGGLGKKGSGMGRVGTGKGAAGNAQGVAGGGQSRVAIRANGPEETVVMGSIDRNAVAEAIYAHRDEFRLCYEREINAENPNLVGQVNTSFVIGSSGRVTQAGIESSSLKNSNAERCILGVLKRIDFPIPIGGGIVEVHFPFKFSSLGGR